MLLDEELEDSFSLLLEELEDGPEFEFPPLLDFGMGSPNKSLKELLTFEEESLFFEDEVEVDPEKSLGRLHFCLRTKC